MSEESEQAARNNAAHKREDDLAFLSTYISTDAGYHGNKNADVLGRLLIDAHARLGELEHSLDAIKHYLENVVATKLHELRQLPGEVSELRDTLPLYAALRDRIAIVEKDLQSANVERLPEGVTRDLG